LLGTLDLSDISNSPLPDTFTALAFDFGTHNIGVAVGQAITRSASELPALKAKDGIPNWDKLGELLNEWQPHLVVVGLPLNMDGSEQELTRRARKFGNRIQGMFGYKVEFFDERLTTRAAKEDALAQGHRGNFRDKPIDSIAAKLIFESWLNAY
jgi:RNAse H-fold protein YqgF